MSTFVWRSVVVVALALTASLCLPSQALAQETGTVTGRVANVATGEYLNNARVTVKGTTQEAFTDRFGEFQIYDVPAGTVTLVVFYTGLDPKEVQIQVDAGGYATQEISLTSVSRYGAEEDGVTLDEFVIQTTRETNAASIAQNEQRFSPNLKNVVAADSFGDVAEGNIGEFMKYLPGVTVDYVAADVRTMSVRGFADNFTSISFNGARMASSNSGNNSRAFEFEQVSINNISRVEVVKVPTADLPADSLGGAVNMIPKSAFERKGSEFRYKAYLSMNSEDLNIWEKTPGPADKMSYKALPGADFDWTIPVNDRLGFVITGLTSNQFNEQHRSQSVWNFNNAALGTTPAGIAARVTNPYLQTYQLQDGPKRTYRNSVSLRTDYKLAPGQVLSLGLQTNIYASFFGNRNITWNVGTTSATTGTTTMSWGSTFSRGATGRGVATHGQSFRDKNGGTRAADLKYTFTGPKTTIEAGLAGSISKTWYRDTSEGHFSQMQARLRNVSRVNFLNIQEPRPQVIETLTSTGTPIAWENLNEWYLTDATSQPVDGRDEFTTYFANVKQNLDFLPFYASVKIGGDIRKQTRDNIRQSMAFTYVGPDGIAGSNTNGDNFADKFLDTRYGVDPYWDFQQQIQWISPYRAYENFVSNRNEWRFLASENSRNEANALRNKKRNSIDVQETITAGYIRFDARMLENKLNLVFGARYEKTEDDGNGPLFIGPTVGHGATNSTTFTTTAQYVEELQRVQNNLIERGLHASTEYDDVYPSASLAYNITDDIIFRAAYAKTIGRPDFSNILPQSRVNETNTVFNDGVGNINAHTAIVNNTGLEPWSGDNYDLAIEYYAPTGTTLSAGVFRKDLANFFFSETTAMTPELAAQFNLEDYSLDPNDPEHLASLTTSFNSEEDARITGTEFNVSQPLQPLGDWARGLRMSGNITLLDLDAPSQRTSSSFARFIPKSGSLSLNYSVKPIVVMVKWTYRGEQKRNSTATQNSTVAGATGSTQVWEYYRPRRDVDINIEYQLSKAATIFVNARNIFTSPQELERRIDGNIGTGIWEGLASPAYSHLYNREEYGVQITVGVKGRF